MRVEQFVMAYQADQDRIRALLPEEFESLRPVLRINAEIRRTEEEETLYLEFNTPVAASGKRGWLNIAHWESAASELISCVRKGKSVTLTAPFLEITYTGTGFQGGCPAEQDNDGCFFIGAERLFRPKEEIDVNKEFCDCSFAWKFAEGDANGVSVGEMTKHVVNVEPKTACAKQLFSAETAAAIPCQQILGAYTVQFDRSAE